MGREWRNRPGRRCLKRPCASREGAFACSDGVRVGKQGGERVSGDLAGRAARGPESYAWPLAAVVVVILPQILIPAGDRVGPPLLVPAVETVALLVLVGIAAQRGPVPPSARSWVLALFGILVVANAAAAVRLVSLVLDNHTIDGAAPTVERLLVAAVLILFANVVTFGLLYWQLDGGGPAGRIAVAPRFPDFQF